MGILRDDLVSFDLSVIDAASRQSRSKALLDFRAWLDDYRTTCQRLSETHDDAATRRHWSGAVEALTWVHKRFSEVEQSNVPAHASGRSAAEDR